jgi:CDGSH-type Zn-finger protein/uncharacterized Fe-S cluster protein YjdI
MDQKIHTYKTDKITVTYDVKRCIHARECVKGLREVFDPAKRPWIQPQNAAPNDIMDVIERCPTGALHYTDHTGERIENAAPLNTLHPVTDGPIYVRGNLELQDENGTTLLKDTRMALCRCGKSMNKPLCDNSHLEAGFRADSHFDPSSLEPKPPAYPAADSPLTLKAQRNGPVLIQGTYRLQASGELSVDSTKNIALCRCGGSASKPFCDGTHKKIGFES